MYSIAAGNPITSFFKRAAGNIYFVIIDFVSIKRTAAVDIAVNFRVAFNVYRVVVGIAVAAPNNAFFKLSIIFKCYDVVIYFVR